MIAPDDSVVRLLREIRAGQQEHLELYRQYTQRALEAQQAALALQRRNWRLYRIVLGVMALLMAALAIRFLLLPI
ncbi:MAG: hypothetical protein DWB45_11465 [Xanthomonadales bacterium]|nr:hypothetical protein [Xanthomonadales bacterium]MDL1870420.1 hypothetical protein [Gammaproteobacteria bacterium PRO6]